MAQKAPCSCGCGKLVSALTDYCHHLGKTMPHAKATCLASQSLTATTTKFHPSHNNSPQRKWQRTNPGPPPPLEIQDRGAIHTSGWSVNDVLSTANMAVDMESVNPPLPPLSSNHSETEDIEPVVNPCAEAWTSTSHYWAAVGDADSNEESDGDKGRTPSSESEDGGDGLLSDSDSSDGGLGIEDTINDKFEQELGNFGAYPNMPSPSQF